MKEAATFLVGPESQDLYIERGRGHACGSERRQLLLGTPGYTPDRLPSVTMPQTRVRRRGSTAYSGRDGRELYLGEIRGVGAGDRVARPALWLDSGPQTRITRPSNRRA